MKRLVLWVTVAAITGLIAACIAIPAQSADDVRDIFYANQTEADDALRQFESEHPKCPLWTNWQKLCSRVDGRTSCKIDAHAPARPSVPFCITEWESHSPRESQSSMRFCEAIDFITGPGGRTRVCDGYRASRPFNGRILGTLRSPACLEWSEVITQKKICNEESGSCRNDISSGNGFYCSKFRQKSCDDFSSYRNSIEKNGTYSGPNYPIDKSPVHGISCGDL